MYKVGDKVVYPHHGAGTVVKREKKEVLGEKREYLTIKIDHNDMTVNVPAENAERVGLRKVIDEDAVKKVFKYLTSGGTEMPKNWNRRFKHNRDKMKTGDIFELAEVVCNLALRDGEKGLSTGEKQMYVKAKKILASELMYAKNMSEDETMEWLEGVLTGGIKVTAAPEKKAPAAEKSAAPARPAAKKAAPAKKAAAAKKPAAKAPVKKAPVKKAPAKAVAAKTKTAASKTSASRTTASRTTASKAAPKKTAAARKPAAAKKTAAAKKPVAKKKAKAAA